MFEKIVLATDLSPVWDEIVSCGTELRALGCSQVILTHVITAKFFVGLTEKLRAEAQPILEEQKKRLETQGLKVITEIPVGLPASSLNDVACRHGASLLVVGSHGKSLWREGVLGSFSSAVLHHTAYPVLLLNIKINEEKEQGTCRLHCTELLQNILFPIDFSPTAETALEFLGFLAPKGARQITLLHALEAPGCEQYPPGYRETAEAVARNFLDKWQKKLVSAGFSHIYTRLTPGHPIAVIGEALRTTDFSLIIMGTQGKGFIKEIFLGSVAHNVSRLAPCPVLLIPPCPR